LPLKNEKLKQSTGGDIYEGVGKKFSTDKDRMYNSLDCIDYCEVTVNLLLEGIQKGLAVHSHIVIPGRFSIARKSLRAPAILRRH